MEFNFKIAQMLLNESFSIPLDFLFLLWGEKGNVFYTNRTDDKIREDKKIECQ